jgi:hypothetical protein
MHCYANEVVPQGWWIQSFIDQKGIETRLTFMHANLTNMTFHNDQVMYSFDKIKNSNPNFLSLQTPPFKFQ